MVFVLELLGLGYFILEPYLGDLSGKEPVSIVEGNEVAQLARRLAVSEAEPRLSFHEHNSLVQVLRANALDQLGVGVTLEAGNHLAVASPVEVPPLAGGLARVVDRAAAREHEAERAGLGARRHAGEHRALVPVAPHVGDDRLVQAPERFVPGELAASPSFASLFAWYRTTSSIDPGS